MSKDKNGVWLRSLAVYMHKIHTLLAILKLLQYTEYQQDFFMLPLDPGLSLLLPLTSTKWTEAESLHSRNPFHYSPHCCFMQNCALLFLEDVHSSE